MYKTRLVKQRIKARLRKTRPVFCYDSEGFFTCEKLALRDSYDLKTWVRPLNSTFIAPPKLDIAPNLRWRFSNEFNEWRAIEFPVEPKVEIEYSLPVIPVKKNWFSDLFEIFKIKVWL